MGDDIVGRLSLDGPGWLCKDFYGADWLWRGAHKAENNVRGWLPAEVPSSVPWVLWRNGVIPDPYLDDQSRQAEWVAQRTWLFKRDFTIDEAWRGRRLTLRFGGVDYRARFFLNGELLGEHTGLFTPVEFPLADGLRWGAPNHLCVVLEEAPPEQPQVGYTSRVRTHKPRMNYWWDFCCRLVHQGIWEGVEILSGGPVRLHRVWVRPRLSPDLGEAVLDVAATLTGPAGASAIVQAALDGERAVASGAADLAGDGTPVEAKLALHVPRPRLWWPNGLGEPALYQVRITVRDEADRVSDRAAVKTGFRSMAWERNPGAPPDARPYVLRVNGRPCYIKGWNWVPVDAMYGRPDLGPKYARLIGLAREAHVNLLRVWGGGLIERESFYDLCDRSGIMVWQEFIQSSSGIDNTPPDDPAFLAMMDAEAREIIPGRRNHPSLAVWCGGNELCGADGKPATGDEPVLRLLGAAAAELDPDRPFWPSSPSGPVFGLDLAALDRDGAALHEVHGPWHYQGPREQYELFNRSTALFHSEFGVPGAMSRRSLAKCLSARHRWPPEETNPVWCHHGAWWLTRRPVEEIFGPVDDLGRYVQASQYLQAEGLRYALEANRRRQYRCSGSIPWQLNEPWPNATCTSAVDYYTEPKMAYYYAALANRPFHLSAACRSQAWAPGERWRAEIWAHNERETPIETTIRARLRDLAGEVLAAAVYPARVAGDASVPIGEMTWEIPAGYAGVFHLSLEADGPDGGRIRNDYLYSSAGPPLLAPLFSLAVADCQARLNATGPGAGLLTLVNRGPVTALFAAIEASEPTNLYVQGNYQLLAPGEEGAIRASWNTDGEVPELFMTGWNLPTRELSWA